MLTLYCLLATNYCLLNLNIQVIAHSDGVFYCSQLIYLKLRSRRCFVDNLSRIYQIGLEVCLFLVPPSVHPAHTLSLRQIWKNHTLLCDLHEFMFISVYRCIACDYIACLFSFFYCWYCFILFTLFWSIISR